MARIGNLLQNFNDPLMKGRSIVHNVSISIIFWYKTVKCVRSAQTYYRRTIFIICTKYKYIRVLYSYCNFPCVYMYENVTFWTSELCFISDRECTSINVKQRRRNDIYFIQQTVIHSAKIYTKVKILGCKWLISVVFFHNSCQLVIILLNTQKKVSQGKEIFLQSRWCNG